MADAKSNPILVIFNPFAISGALSMLSFAHEAIPWHQDIQTWLDAWHHFTHAGTGFLFGWLPALLHLQFPEWAHDYLAMGVISAIAQYRAINALQAHRLLKKYNYPFNEYRDFYISLFFKFILRILIWPRDAAVTIVLTTIRLFPRSRAYLKLRYPVYPEHINEAPKVWLDLFHFRADLVANSSELNYYSSLTWIFFIIAINYALTHPS
jgi:hypothetical protein